MSEGNYAGCSRWKWRGQKEKMMPKYIDADSLKQYINDRSTHWLSEWSTLGMLGAVDAQPAADVAPVVHCRECKHRNYDGAGKPWCDEHQQYIN